VVPFIPEGYYQRPTNSQLMVINIMTIVQSTGFIMFFIYYLNKISLIKELKLNKYEIKEEEVKSTIETEDIKYDNLYNDILNYFSEKKPYCKPDFTIVQRAKDIDSNVKYVSKVINMKENVNFNVFINMHRVRLIKELIAMNYHNKYTIRYIYTSAGFKHQSTFNKVFKDIEGITPSEYIKSNKYREQFPA
jgi:AraC-like DNA-binding protein